MSARQPPSPATHNPKATRCGLELWRAALCWRRHVDAALAPLDLNLAQWTVLQATAAAIEQAGDAVSQNAIATQAQVDKVTISHMILTLESRGWVDRGPASSGRAYRVRLTRRGARVLATASARVHQASHAALGPFAPWNRDLVDKLRQID